MWRYAKLYSSGKNPASRQHFSSRILLGRKLSESYFLLTMDQTKSSKLQKKHLESAEERRARLDKNNEKARAKSRTETEQKKSFYLISLTPN